MGLFDSFKKKTDKSADKKASVPTVPESEKKYYQPDDYYTAKSHEGTPFEKAVITFDERKKTSIPSEHGLYVAEILLLEYCSYGKYPAPSNGYPGFWWFEYGIRDVAAALKSLESRGFIKYGSPYDTLTGWKVADLKNLLNKHDESVAGKKSELIERVKQTITEQELLSEGAKLKYVLTEMGQAELADNAYVPYMHKHPHKTIEGNQFGTEFNVWSINRLLGTGNKDNWKKIVDQVEYEIKKATEIRNAEQFERLKSTDPEIYTEVKNQDDQLALINKAEDQYKKDGNIDSLILFWEDLWEHGGLKFEGSRWHFRLADLYIKKKEYDKAMEYCKMIKKEKLTYADKADGYIIRIKDMKRLH